MRTPEWVYRLRRRWDRWRHPRPANCLTFAEFDGRLRADYPDRLRETLARTTPFYQALGPIVERKDPK